MSLSTFKAEVRARTERAASWRSDDFGHDTHALLLAESEALQVAADDITRLLAIVERLERAYRLEREFRLTRETILTRESIAKRIDAEVDKLAGGGEE